MAYVRLYDEVDSYYEVDFDFSSYDESQLQCSDCLDRRIEEVFTRETGTITDNCVCFSFDITCIYNLFKSFTCFR